MDDIQQPRTKMESRDEENAAADHGKSLMTWEIPEFEQHERGRLWYIIAFVVVAALLVWALLNANYLFAILIIIFAITSYLQISRHPADITVRITEKGVAIGDRLYRYDTLRAFWVIYKPPVVNALYLEFKNSLRPEMSIPLKKKNPVKVREILLDYLTEDLEKEEESFSDQLRRQLKL